MPEEAVSAAATASATPQGDSGAGTSPPSSGATPDTGAPAATPKAETPASPAGKIQDVRSGLMDAAKAALQKTRTGQPSAQQKGSGNVAAAPPSAATGSAV